MGGNLSQDSSFRGYRPVQHDPHMLIVGEYNMGKTVTYIYDILQHVQQHGIAA